MHIKKLSHRFENKRKERKEGEKYGTSLARGHKSQKSSIFL